MGYWLRRRRIGGFNSSASAVDAEGGQAMATATGFLILTENKRDKGTGGVFGFTKEGLGLPTGGLMPAHRTSILL